MDKDPIDALFEVPLDEFVAARNALSKELKAKGDAAGAKAVAALRRPAAAAWAVNQLARTRGGDVAALLEASAALRQAQSRPGGQDALRAALSDQRAALSRLLEAERGLPGASPARERKVQTTLQAAAAGDDELRERLRAGRLFDEVEAAGFGALMPGPGEMAAKQATAEEPAPARHARKHDARAHAAEEHAAHAAEKHAAHAAEEHAAHAAEKHAAHAAEEHAAHAAEKHAAHAPGAHATTQGAPRHGAQTGRAKPSADKRAGARHESAQPGPSAAGRALEAKAERERRAEQLRAERQRKADEQRAASAARKRMAADRREREARSRRAERLDAVAEKLARKAALAEEAARRARAGADAAAQAAREARRARSDADR